MNLTVIEPATGKVLAEVPRATEADVDVAVAAAKRAQREWALTTPGAKSAVLHQLANRIDEHSEVLARLEARDVGMPLSDARAAVATVAATFRYYAAGPERLMGKTIPVADGIDMTFHEPIGVVGLITPWNFPLLIASWKVAPALAAGNGVGPKAPELAPLSTMELQKLAVEAGVPEGLFTVLVGPGATVGRALVEHPDVGKIAFTGSTSVGMEIGARRHDPSSKRVTLELGGKSASIVLRGFRPAGGRPRAGRRRSGTRARTAVLAREFRGGIRRS